MRARAKVGAGETLWTTEEGAGQGFGGCFSVAATIGRALFAKGGDPLLGGATQEQIVGTVNHEPKTLIQPPAQLCGSCPAAGAALWVCRISRVEPTFSEIGSDFAKEGAPTKGQPAEVKIVL